MNRNVLIAIIFVLAAVVGFFAYQAYEREQNTLSIDVGPNGLKIDPPGN
jgi:hypothetical protein